MKHYKNLEVLKSSSPIYPLWSILGFKENIQNWKPEKKQWRIKRGPNGQTYQPAAKSLKQNQNQRPTKVYAPETTEKQVT